MQKTTTAERGIQLTGIFCAVSMFFVMRDPFKFSWIIAMSACAMVYFASRKFRDDKKAGRNTQKARDIIIMGSVSVLILAACVFAYFFID